MLPAHKSLKLPFSSFSPFTLLVPFDKYNKSVILKERETNSSRRAATSLGCNKKLYENSVIFNDDQKGKQNVKKH